MGYQLDVVTAERCRGGSLRRRTDVRPQPVRVGGSESSPKTRPTAERWPSSAPTPKPPKNTTMHFTVPRIESSAASSYRSINSPRTPKPRSAETRNSSRQRNSWLWGQHVNSGSTGLLHPVRHELSAAARTFKAEALRCAALDTRVDPWEEFWAAKILDPAPFGSSPAQPARAARHLGAPEPTANNRARSPSVVGGFPRG